MNDFYIQVASTIAAGGITVICFFIWKIATKIDPILEFMKETRLKDFEQDERIDVHDRAWTLTNKKNFDSKLIASGDMEFPHVKLKREH